MATTPTLAVVIHEQTKGQMPFLAAVRVFGWSNAHNATVGVVTSFYQTKPAIEAAYERPNVAIVRLPC